MSTGKQLAALLLLSTALTVPGIALAQGTAGEPDTGAEGIATEGPEADEALPEPAGSDVDGGAYEEPDISIPGGAIVVTGRRMRDVTRSSTQVVSVLSSEEIARTGEGDIAGALGRVTGLSVQGAGYVYVRGLGDRYSLALLNGLPLPSPEPLSRVVPLDIFPTNVIASSLVQKTYSANFPGEFGGGVINLTTRAIPEKTFLDISIGTSGDSETTGRNGYSYFGSDSDWTGFDDGSRNLPPALADFFNSGTPINDLPRDQEVAVLKELTRPNFTALQKIGNLPPNFSASITGGTAFDVGGDGRLGVIASASISNKWRNRNIHKQLSVDPNLIGLEEDFQTFTTDNRILVNGLLGVGLELGQHKFRATGLYIRDTIKQSSLALGENFNNGNREAQQDTAWYERQLIDAQFVGEMKFADLAVDVRAGYAQTQREAPWEFSFLYFDSPTDRYPDLYRNTLDGQRSYARVAFSDLTEDLYYGGIDFSYPVMDWATLTAGYAYSDTSRFSLYRPFEIRASGLPEAFSLFNPLYLYGPAIIDFGNHPANPNPYAVTLVDRNSDTPAVQADLTIHAGYGQARFEPFSGLTVDLGVRYEDAKQSVRPVPPSISTAATALSNDYWLPAGTITYDFDNGLQARISASKTIARPQFRELIFQPFEDPETSRLYRGNPELRDSELINAEARLEYYFERGSRVSVAGFYKDIDNPIEAYSILQDGRITTSFANAPSAELYGAELELQYNHDLVGLGNAFATKRAVLVANYTYTQSKIKVGPDDVTYIFNNGNDPRQPAANFFDNGIPMTGQSDHLVNLQFGIEDTEKVQQLTVLLSYASKRVVSRGFNRLPPIVENPGLQLDIVAREEVNLLGQPVELKFEVRNLTGRGHEEYQSNGTNRIEVNTYDIGTSVSASASIKF